MKTQKTYPMYVCKFGGEWAIQRRRYGGIITSRATRDEALDQAEKEADRYARIYGTVQILLQDENGSFKPYQTVERQNAGARK